VALSHAAPHDFIVGHFSLRTIPARCEVALGHLGRYHKRNRHSGGFIPAFILCVALRPFQPAAGIVGRGHDLPSLVVFNVLAILFGAQINAELERKLS
jgi:hypothetical protein